MGEGYDILPFITFRVCNFCCQSVIRSSLIILWEVVERQDISRNSRKSAATPKHRSLLFVIIPLSNRCVWRYVAQLRCKIPFKYLHSLWRLGAKNQFSNCCCRSAFIIAHSNKSDAIFCFSKHANLKNVFKFARNAKVVFLQAITHFFISSTFQAELPNAMQLLRHHQQWQCRHCMIKRCFNTQFCANYLASKPQCCMHACNSEYVRST